MASDREQLSAWATDEEAEEIKAAAKREDRSVSKFLVIAGLERARQTKAAK